jgi:glycosyltransferase involved in cell wall biosynthesis
MDDRGRATSKSARNYSLHIAMVVPTYLPESFGGAEQQCRKLSHALSRLGVRVTILAPQLLSATPRIEQHGSVSIRRFRVRKAPNLGGRHAGSLLLWSAAVLMWLWLHRREIDVIHIFHGRLHALPAVLGGVLTHKPSLVKIGRGGEHFDLRLVRGKRLGGQLAYRTLLKHASGYIANSCEIVDALLEHGVSQDRIFAVPNGVETPGIDFGNVSSPANGPRQYIYLGRLDPEKRIDFMLKGFARFSDRSARLTVLGDGVCRRQLELLASDLGLRDRISFPGRTDDVARHLRSAHFYLSTSASEGMSNALLEAMSFGVVPLVSDVSGARDIVEPGRTGFLFRPDDLGDFVAKLELGGRIDGESYRAISEAARQSIRQNFGIDQIADQHLQIYRAALGQSSLPRPCPSGPAGSDRVRPP